MIFWSRQMEWFAFTHSKIHHFQSKNYFSRKINVFLAMLRICLIFEIQEVFHLPFLLKSYNNTWIFGIKYAMLYFILYEFVKRKLEVWEFMAFYQKNKIRFVGVVIFFQICQGHCTIFFAIFLCSFYDDFLSLFKRADMFMWQIVVWCVLIFILYIVIWLLLDFMMVSET